jgi:hypothetical protein
MSQPEVIDTIASALSESAEEPMRLIREIVDELGHEATLALLEETRRVEEAGGMTVARGTRRRSPGGVFFKLAKDRLSTEARKRIFRSPHPEPKASEDTPPSESKPRVEPPPRRATPKPAPAPPPPAPRGMPEVVVRPRRRMVVSSPAPVSVPDPVRAVPRPAPNVVGFRRDPPGYGAPARDAAPAIPEEPRRASPPIRERVLVRVAPQSDVPAKTLDEAIDRVARLLTDLDDKTARAALLEVIDRKGGLPVPEPEPEPEPEPTVDVEQLRQSILVNVVRALNLDARDLAAALYGNDSPTARRKARALLGDGRG